MECAAKHFQRADHVAAATAQVLVTEDAPAVKDAPEEVVVLMVSDLQIGKRTKSFNSEVARHRMREYASKASEEVKGRIRQGKRVTRAHVWLMGDIVEGEDIFPGQAHEIHECLMAQMTDAVKMLVEFVRTVHNVVEAIHITGVVGNHGRLGRKGQYSQASNADKMVQVKLDIRESFIHVILPRPH